MIAVKPSSANLLRGERKTPLGGRLSVQPTRRPQGSKAHRAKRVDAVPCCTNGQTEKELSTQLLKCPKGQRGLEKQGAHVSVLLLTFKSLPKSYYLLSLKFPFIYQILLYIKLSVLRANDRNLPNFL